jgi:hypothetical protein
MRKAHRIGLLAGLLVVIGGMAFGLVETPQAKPGPGGEVSSELRKVVLDYYSAYIAYQQYAVIADKKGKPVPDRTLNPRFVTPHFIDSYRKMMAENDKLTPKGEVGPLDYDPIVCGQDFPDSMAGSSVVLVKNSETVATLKVGLAGFTPPPPPIIVKLNKQKQGWRIDSIVCDGMDFDAMYRTMKNEAR